MFYIILRSLFEEYENNHITYDEYFQIVVELAGYHRHRKNCFKYKETINENTFKVQLTPMISEAIYM